MSLVSVYITCKDQTEAEKIALKLLKERLIACANIFPIKSHYWWDEKIQHASETVIIAKSKAELFENVKKKVKELHSYSVPCIVAWPIIGAEKDYADWIKKETK